jgi:hypothetical protein
MSRPSRLPIAAISSAKTFGPSAKAAAVNSSTGPMRATQYCVRGIANYVGSDPAALSSRRMQRGAEMSATDLLDMGTKISPPTPTPTAAARVWRDPLRDWHRWTIGERIIAVGLVLAPAVTLVAAIYGMR